MEKEDLHLKNEDLFTRQRSKAKEGEMSRLRFKVCVDPENVLWETGNSLTGVITRTTLEEDFQ